MLQAFVGGFSIGGKFLFHILFTVVKDAQFCVCRPSLTLQYLSFLTSQHCCHLWRAPLSVHLIAQLQDELQSHVRGFDFHLCLENTSSDFRKFEVTQQETQ